MASDRWGRKPVIYAGLVLFAAGSFLAASASDIWIAIAGRALQGAGAISSVVMALAADLTREAAPHQGDGDDRLDDRLQLRAVAGRRAGALPLDRHGRHVRDRRRCCRSRRSGWSRPWCPTCRMRRAARRGRRRASPGWPRRSARSCCASISASSRCTWCRWRCSWSCRRCWWAPGLALAEHWKLYLPVVLASFAVMVPPILYADRRNRPKPVLVGCGRAAVRGAGGHGAGRARRVPRMAALLFAFFVAFNVLEAILPSLVSRIAPARARGTAIGVYNTTQTLGLFVGGLARRLDRRPPRPGHGVRRLRGGGACLAGRGGRDAAPQRAVRPRPTPQSTRPRARRCIFIQYLDQGDCDGIR